MFPFTPTSPTCSLFLRGVPGIYIYIFASVAQIFFPSFRFQTVCVSRVARKQLSHLYKNKRCNSSFKYILYVWFVAMLTECEWILHGPMGMWAGMMQTKDRKIWRWCGYSIYRIYHSTRNSPVESAWKHYII